MLQYLINMSASRPWKVSAASPKNRQGTGAKSAFIAVISACSLHPPETIHIEQHFTLWRYEVSSLEKIKLGIVLLICYDSTLGKAIDNCNLEASFKNPLSSGFLICFPQLCRRVVHLFIPFMFQKLDFPGLFKRKLRMALLVLTSGKAYHCVPSAFGHLACRSRLYSNKAGNSQQPFERTKIFPSSLYFSKSGLFQNT